MDAALQISADKFIAVAASQRLLHQELFALYEMEYPIAEPNRPAPSASLVFHPPLVDDTAAKTRMTPAAMLNNNSAGNSAPQRISGSAPALKNFPSSFSSSFKASGGSSRGSMRMPASSPPGAPPKPPAAQVPAAEVSAAITPAAAVPAEVKSAVQAESTFSMTSSADDSKKGPLETAALKLVVDVEDDVSPLPSQPIDPLSTSFSPYPRDPLSSAPSTAGPPLESQETPKVTPLPPALVVNRPTAPATPKAPPPPEPPAPPASKLPASESAPKVDIAKKDEPVGVLPPPPPPPSMPMARPPPPIRQASVNPPPPPPPSAQVSRPDVSSEGSSGNQVPTVVRPPPAPPIQPKLENTASNTSSRNITGSSPVKPQDSPLSLPASPSEPQVARRGSRMAAMTPEILEPLPAPLSPHRPSIHNLATTAGISGSSTSINDAESGHSSSHIIAGVTDIVKPAPPRPPPRPPTAQKP